jgi:hypothetical protein
MGDSTNLEADPRTIASRLSVGQRRTVQALDEDYCILGCAAASAKRLERNVPARPALVVSRRGEVHREFALNALGMAVQAVL